jgi:hypothetical protein
MPKAGPQEVDRSTELLDALVRLTALSVLKGHSGGEAIDILVKAGLATDLIAELVGTTAATVRARRSVTNRKGTSKP